MPAPCITKSHSKPLVSSLSWGSAPSTSMLAAPYGAPLALGISSTSACHASDVGCSDAGDSTGATTNRGGPAATTARSLTLAADNATKGRHGDVTGHAAGR
jgi:hypothetical protein